MTGDLNLLGIREVAGATGGAWRTVMAVARRQSADQFGIDLPQSVFHSIALGPEKGCAQELPAGEARSELGGSFSAAAWREHTHLPC